VVILVVSAAAVTGLVAGSYARALAEGFGVDPDDPRKEARAAFSRAIRIVPVPRRPYRIETVTAAVFALLTWRVADVAPPTWRVADLALLAAMLYAALAGVTLAVIDWRTWRLPDAITLTSYPLVVGMAAPTGNLLTAVICGCALGGVYLLLWFVRPAALGLGDVKLAGLIGLLTGAVGVNATVLAGIGGHILGALYAVGLLITRRATRTSEFPFGPFMLAAALLAVLIQ
jgi:leader peptidase (prepilin peptidase)/N-methyltransferase